MAKEMTRIPAFEDIVFVNRNKDYGAYLLRKEYSRNVIISVLTGIVIMAAVVIVPYFKARVLGNRQNRFERQVEIKMENLEQANEIVAPPPAPPPPVDIVQQAKYIPPVVVDTIKPEETQRLMTADEAQIEVTNREAVEIVQDIKPEVQEDEVEPEPFISVEEMPVFPGGDAGLLKYLYDNTKYPEIARDNNIQGKVIVKFCVTATGGVDLVSIFKGVDPELDAEAIRVVKTLPKFKPGKQGGKCVRVWFSVPINFQIQR